MSDELRDKVADWFKETPESLEMLAEERAELAGSETREAVAEAMWSMAKNLDKVSWSTCAASIRDSWRSRAEAAIAAHLEALGAGGYVVVKLPEAQLWDGPGQERYWRVDDTTVQVDKFNVATVDIDDDWDDLGATPDQFRRLAAALLAAAAKAEES